MILVDGIRSADGTVRVKADDEGLLLGRGAFETMRTYGGRLYGLDAHLDRLMASCAALMISMPDESLLLDELETVTSDLQGDCMVRVTVTAGGLRIVRSAPLPSAPTSMAVATRFFVPPPWLDGSVKHTSRAYSRLAVMDAGVDEVLWFDEEDQLLEGTRSNIFAVRGGVLLTPPADGRILAGVTREGIIEAAVTLGIEVLCTNLSRRDRFDELYLCSTLKELVPISEMDGQPYRGSGPVGAALLDEFRRSASSA